jgi:UDP-galactopyranose mutase
MTTTRDRTRRGDGKAGAVDITTSPLRPEAGGEADLICLSHLRWDLVYQRPQHLMSRCARERRVFFVEEPVFVNDHMAQLDLSRRADGVLVVVPRLPKGLGEQEVTLAQRALLDELITEQGMTNYLLWYYTPMALAFTRHLKPAAIVYDCMDELSAFRAAPPAMREREAELLKLADVVFTGGPSLYEAKRDRHPNTHLFPSSIDAAHFAAARSRKVDPADQRAIPRPRVGFFGVIDERMDVELLAGVADARPDWHIVMVGPVVKIDPATLPRRPNIHYLGGKDYKELPAYLAGWEVALMPFARNESTRFISPTKTPEYLAAGKPVVSTSIRDVARLYGESGLVLFADSTEDFVAAIESSLGRKRRGDAWLKRVDELLAQTSWDGTWARMARIIEAAAARRREAVAAPKAAAAHAPRADAEAFVTAD